MGAASKNEEPAERNEKGAWPVERRPERNHGVDRELESGEITLAGEGVSHTFQRKGG